MSPNDTCVELRERDAASRCNNEQDLERRWRVAEQRVRIAEDLGWVLASGAGLYIYFVWPNDLAWFFAFSVTYVASVYPLGKARKVAAENLRKVTGIRKINRTHEAFGG